MLVVRLGFDPVTGCSYYVRMSSLTYCFVCMHAASIHVEISVLLCKNALLRLRLCMHAMLSKYCVFMSFLAYIT